jgi:hypothetical protein
MAGWNKNHFTLLSEEITAVRAKDLGSAGEALDELSASLADRFYDLNDSFDTDRFLNTTGVARDSPVRKTFDHDE